MLLEAQYLNFVEGYLLLINLKKGKENTTPTKSKAARGT
jgi:hypothetical protein